MSTKTIAVETSVYERLAGEKRDAESFTKVIDRLLSIAAEGHTGMNIAAAAAGFDPLSARDAEKMLSVIEENRKGEAWTQHDLR